MPSKQTHGVAVQSFWIRHKITVIKCALLFFCAVFLHVFYMPKDYSVEAEIISALGQGSIYHPSGYFSDAEHVCFLDPYWTPGKIDVPLSEIARFELNIKINGIIGTDDSIWWLVGIKSNEVSFIYKMSMGSLLRFPKDKTVCVSAKKFTLKPVENKEHPRYKGVLFEIIQDG